MRRQQGPFQLPLRAVLASVAMTYSSQSTPTVIDYSMAAHTANETGLPLEFSNMPMVNTSHITQIHTARMIQGLVMQHAVDSGVNLTDPVQRAEFYENMASCAKFLTDRDPNFNPHESINDAQLLLTTMQKMVQMSAEQSAAQNTAVIAQPTTSGPEDGGPNNEGGKKPQFWSGASGWQKFGTAAGIGTLFGIVSTIDGLSKDPMVPEARLGELMNLPEAKVKAIVADTHAGVTCSSRLRESDAERIVALKEKTENIQTAVHDLLGGATPDKVLVQFAGSGQAAAGDFGALNDSVEIIPGVRIGKLAGTNGESHLVVSIDGPGMLPSTLFGAIAGLVGTQPTPTGMAVCANIVVKAIQALQPAHETLTVNVETFSRGGSGGAIYTQLNAENTGIHLDKMVMFDPEQGPNVSVCDRKVQGYDSLDVVRAGANEYFRGMPATQLILQPDEQSNMREHSVITTHGGTKECAGDMQKFHCMMMEDDRDKISAHLKNNAVQITKAAVKDYNEESQYQVHYETPKMDAAQAFSTRMGLYNSKERAAYAWSAVQEANEGIVRGLAVTTSPVIDLSSHYSPQGNR